MEKKRRDYTLRDTLFSHTNRFPPPALGICNRVACQYSKRVKEVLNIVVVYLPQRHKHSYVTFICYNNVASIIFFSKDLAKTFSRQSFCQHLLSTFTHLPWLLWGNNDSCRSWNVSWKCQWKWKYCLLHEIIKWDGNTYSLLIWRLHTYIHR